jgi:quinol-cytochrome oxidoreductase complex cytochrome b subunit
MVALSLSNDPMLIPASRDEEDTDDLYTDDFFFLHERGVDLIYILLMFHFLRKLYLTSYSKNQEISWKNGALLFLILHGTIFFGLVLCCTHLSDITLTIAANIINTLTFKFGKLYCFLFTDQTLNTDTIIRSMYLHYILGFFSLVVGFIHSDSMHYDYKDKSQNSGIELDFE